MRKITTRIFIALCFSSLYSYAQKGDWEKPGGVWEYNMSKKMPGQDSISGDNLQFASSAGKETFLVSPPSGSAMVSSTKGNPSFIRKSGSNAGLKIRGASTDGSPTKFAVSGIKDATPVMSISFTIKPDHNATKTDWYFVLGKSSPIFTDPGTILPISKTGSSPNGHIFASFRIQSNASFGDKASNNYRLQLRQQPELEEDITWTNNNTALFNKGKSHQVEIYANNGATAQKYTLNGSEHTLPARTYHLWINSTQFGGNLPANAIRRNQPIDAFLLMSRDAVAGTDGPSNLSTLEISNVKVKYASK